MNVIYCTNEKNVFREQEQIDFNAECKKSEMKTILVELPLNQGLMQPGYFE